MNEVLICGLTGLHSPRESGSYVEKQPAIQKKKKKTQAKQIQKKRHASMFPLYFGHWEMYDNSHKNSSYVQQL